jgi:hypothetical protein
MIGEYWYRTETYTVRTSDGKSETRTRVVQETEWWPLSGRHKKYYSGFMVSGSTGLPQSEAAVIQPYQLDELVRFKPYFLAGWMSEEYSVEAERALVVAQNEFRNRERSSVQGNLPGDISMSLRVDTDFKHNGSDLILLPVHILTYHYRNQTYRFLVNGQTGKFYGEKPWSKIRIAVAVIIAIVVVLAIVAGIVIASGGSR